MAAPFDALKIDARLEGMCFTAPPSAKTKFEYSFSHEVDITNIRFVGISLYAWDSNKGDNVTLSSEYYVPSLSAWKRYKKFAKTWQVFPNMEMKDLLFPTTPTNGIKLVIEYENKGIASVDFSVNLYNFVDIQTVDTSIAAEGVDW